MEEYCLLRFIDQAVEQVNARENRSFNNHWYMACNGVMIHVTPTNYYRKLKEVTEPKELAGIKLRAFTEHAFSDVSSKYSYEFSGLSCFERDLIPLLWVNK